MSQFLHQIFYADNKFGITDIYADLHEWAIPKPIYDTPIRMTEHPNTPEILTTTIHDEPIRADTCTETPDTTGIVATGQRNGTDVGSRAMNSPTHGMSKNKVGNRLSIFQSIFILHYGFSEFTMLGNRIANREIEEKQKIMETLSKTPKKLKDGTQKLTNDNIQEIISGLFVSSKEEVMHIVAYSAFYNKIIYLVFQHSYLVFSPTKDIEITETRIREHDVYILYQTRKHPKYGGSYYPELEPTLGMIQQIHNTKVHLEHYAKPFRGISAYKMTELERIANKIGILEENPADTTKPVKHNKRELYDKIVEICCEGICV